MKTLILSAVLLTAVSVSADTVVWGDPNVDGSTVANVPFGSGALEYQRLQQVHEASLFGEQPVPIAITGIAFRADKEMGRSVDWTFASVQVVLSTTQNGPGTLSAFFAQNLSSDAAVAMLAMPFSLRNTFIPFQVQPFEYKLSFSEPFIYHQSRGNLLVDIVVRGDSRSGAWLDAKTGIASRSVYLGFEGPQGGFGNSGLVTQFTFFQIPEPSSAALLGLGFIVLFKRLSQKRE